MLIRRLPLRDDTDSGRSSGWRRTVESILRCLGLPTEAPVVAAARPPPLQRLPW
ncbi:MAG: hypothetical protein AB7O97_14335 [Planctomycetota bacterium]